ncbi:MULTISPECIES: helix-turn-helix transcriptional regulator [Mesorhizobium]|uniref:DNA-binding protein n=1 Tax=Mesorhizobium denitrificans TaxID=2294114 RepID=A0A371XGJ5_9HYPH|nr:MULTISPECIES: helix-turn-helix domain-containing protein [Mesorhizobium]RFC68355.1 DNA-binding protein [Mesorhizobium denitrificans]
MTPISVTIPQAMSMTGLGRSSIYRLFQEKKLTPRKAGKRTLILTSEISDYINSLPTAA